MNGAVGRSVNAGHNSIIWDVLAEMEQLVGDNICFRVNAMSGRGYENGHEWIDLGLSVKWATCNVGASTPEAYGNYYAWGETAPKSNYMGSTYTYLNTPSVLPLNRDAAFVNWGGNWRMPTSDEIQELKEKCKWTWMGRGYKVIGPNGNSIFLPAAGNRTGTNIYDKGLSGCYWSSSFKSEYAKAYYIKFYSNTVYSHTYNRTYGKSVRAVLD